MLLDRPCLSNWGAKKQNTDRLTRHKHAAFHLPRSVACLSSPLCELSAYAYRTMEVQKLMPGGSCTYSTSSLKWCQGGPHLQSNLTTKVKCSTTSNQILATPAATARQFPFERQLKRVTPRTLCLSSWHGLFAGRALRQCNVTIALAMKGAPNLHERESWRCTQLAFDHGANNPAVNTVITTSKVAVFTTKFPPNTARPH